MRVLIIGAGGHAQVIADALLAAQRQGCSQTPVGFLDDDPDLLGSSRLGLPIFGSVRQVNQIAHDALVIGIGNNRTRRKLFEMLSKQGECFAIVCHPTAVVAADAQIGPGTVVLANVVVNTGSQIGANVILNTACTVDHHNQIGDHAHLAPGSHLGGDVQIGSESLVGIGAIVLSQHRVGCHCVVGAGAVVVQDVADRQCVIGVPARPYS